MCSGGMKTEIQKQGCAKKLIKGKGGAFFFRKIYHPLLTFLWLSPISSNVNFGLVRGRDAPKLPPPLSACPFLIQCDNDISRLHTGSNR